MRQNRGEGLRNSMPTSRWVPWDAPTPTTLQVCSSPDLIFRMVSNSPVFTAWVRRIKAPCALTTAVKVSSENFLFVGEMPLTRTWTDSITRWLRRWAFIFCDPNNTGSTGIYPLSLPIGGQLDFHEFQACQFRTEASPTLENSQKSRLSRGMSGGKCSWIRASGLQPTQQIALALRAFLFNNSFS